MFRTTTNDDLAPGRAPGAEGLGPVCQRPADPASSGRISTPWEWGATRSASRCLRACGRSDLGVDPSMGFGSLHSACTGRPQAGASPGLRWAWAPWLPLWLCFVSWCMRAFLFARMAICGCRPAEDQWGAHVSRSLASRQICLEGWGRASARPEIIRKLPRRFSTPPSLDESAIRREIRLA